LIAAITAGGRADARLASATGTATKALISVAGTTLLDAAINAARAAGARRTIVIGDEQVRRHCERRVDRVVPAAVDGGENLRRALREANEDEALLLLSSDLPFVRGPHVAAFLQSARGADVALPLASAAQYECTFPKAPPHATRLGNESVVNASVVFFGPSSAMKARALAERLFAARKSRLAMAGLLGPKLLLRFVCGTLQIADIEARAYEHMRLHARAVRDAAPELCFDVDDIDDYRYAVAYAGRGA